MKANVCSGLKRLNEKGAIPKTCMNNNKTFVEPQGGRPAPHEFLPGQTDGFRRFLQAGERSPATVEKYLREVQCFAAWLKGKDVTKKAVAAYKEELLCRGVCPATINGKLTALDRLFGFLGWEDCKVKHLKVQRRLFREPGRELTREEYLRLVAAARATKKARLALLLEAICATGIRVSEVRYLTVEAARAGKAEIMLKGKVRTILLPNKLCHKLLKYAQKQNIASGEVFVTRSGKSLNRRQIWAEMKALCKIARVAPAKVFPHNLRHLFARVFYKACKDVAKLADVLGHSSIETTRIYLISTGAEHARTLGQLRLVT